MAKHKTTTPTGVRLTNNSLEQLAQIAAQRQVAKTRLIRIAVEAYLEQQKEPPVVA